MNKKAIEIAKRMKAESGTTWALDTQALIDAVLSEEQAAWVPQVGEWATHSIQGYTSRVVETRVENGHLFVWLQNDKSLGIQLQILRQPTREEIALAERREKLLPIPEGWEWVQDRSEKPHAEAKIKQWKNWYNRDALHIGSEYQNNHEYIKPIEPSKPAPFAITKEGVYRRRDGSIVSLRKFHESWRVCEYDEPRYVNAAGQWSGGKESPEDAIEYLAPLPPTGSQLLNLKNGDTLPLDGTTYHLRRDIDEWRESISARRGGIAYGHILYAHKLASETPPEIAFAEHNLTKVNQYSLPAKLVEGESNFTGKPITHWTITTDQTGERE